MYVHTSRRNNVCFPFNLWCRCSLMAYTGSALVSVQKSQFFPSLSFSLPPYQHLPVSLSLSVSFCIPPSLHLSLSPSSSLPILSCTLSLSILPLLGLCDYIVVTTWQLCLVSHTSLNAGPSFVMPNGLCWLYCTSSGRLLGFKKYGSTSYVGIGQLQNGVLYVRYRTSSKMTTAE